MIASWMVLGLLCTAGAGVQAQDNELLGILADVSVLDLLTLVLDIALGGGGGGGGGDDSGGGGGGDSLLGADVEAAVGDLLDIAVDLQIGGGGGGGDDGGDDGGGCEDDDGCLDVPVIDWSLNDEYCDQPVFVSFLPKTDSNCLIDNVCYTFFPAPDDPYTYTLYKSTVFADGSNRVETSIITDISVGKKRAAEPCCTYTEFVVGYAGCDTYVLYRCFNFGDCTDFDGPYVLGLTPLCLPLGLSCVDEIKKIVECSGLPEQDFVILPMKLPNRCVTEQVCVNNIQGNFYRALGLPAPGPVPVLRDEIIIP